MRKIKIKFRNEGTQSVDVKVESYQALIKAPFDWVVYEEGGADLVASRPKYLLAAEVQQTGRNILHDIERDFSKGANDVLVVCPTMAAVREVSAKLNKYLENRFQGRVGIISVNALRMLFPQ